MSIIQYEVFLENIDLLGLTEVYIIDPNISTAEKKEQIKEKFKKLSLKYHPSTNNKARLDRVKKKHHLGIKFGKIKAAQTLLYDYIEGKVVLENKRSYDDTQEPEQNKRQKTNSQSHTDYFKGAYEKCFASLSPEYKILLTKAFGYSIPYFQDALFNKIAEKPFLLDLFSHDNYINIFKKQFESSPTDYVDACNRILHASASLSNLIDNEEQINSILMNIIDNECFDTLMSESSIQNLFCKPNLFLLELADWLNDGLTNTSLLEKKLSIKINEHFVKIDCHIYLYNYVIDFYDLNKDNLNKLLLNYEFLNTKNFDELRNIFLEYNINTFELYPTIPYLSNLIGIDIQMSDFVDMSKEARQAIFRTLEIHSQLFSHQMVQVQLKHFLQKMPMFFAEESSMVFEIEGLAKQLESGDIKLAALMCLKPLTAAKVVKLISEIRVTSQDKLKIEQIFDHLNNNIINNYNAEVSRLKKETGFIIGKTSNLAAIAINSSIPIIIKEINNILSNTTNNVINEKASDEIYDTTEVITSEELEELYDALNPNRLFSNNVNPGTKSPQLDPHPSVIKEQERSDYRN